jgi:hypothetical protein
MLEKMMKLSNIFKEKRMKEQKQKPRVLIVVSGGVAGYVHDDEVDVVIFDWDDYSVDPDRAPPVPEHFRDLAEPLDVPVKGDPK